MGVAAIAVVACLPCVGICAGRPRSHLRPGGLAEFLDDAYLDGNSVEIYDGGPHEGKVVIAGSIDGRGFVLRLNPNGTSDLSFDGDGLAELLPERLDTTAIALYRDGGVAYAVHGGKVRRLLPDGSPDNTFGAVDVFNSQRRFERGYPRAQSRSRDERSSGPSLGLGKQGLRPLPGDPGRGSSNQSRWDAGSELERRFGGTRPLHGGKRRPALQRHRTRRDGSVWAVGSAHRTPLPTSSASAPNRDRPAAPGIHAGIRPGGHLRAQARATTLPSRQTNPIALWLPAPSRSLGLRTMERQSPASLHAPAHRTRHDPGSGGRYRGRITLLFDEYARRTGSKTFSLAQLLPSGARTRVSELEESQGFAGRVRRRISISRSPTRRRSPSAWYSRRAIDPRRRKALRRRRRSDQRARNFHHFRSKRGGCDL